MTPAEYAQLKAFARIDGALLAVAWVVSFACYVRGLASSVLLALGMVIAVWSLFFVTQRTRRFRDEARDGMISFGRAYGYVVLTFFYAAMLFAIAQYIYFAYIDNGWIAAQVAATLSNSENAALLAAYGLDSALEESLAQMAATRPIDYALNYLTVNIMVGMVVGLPIALKLRTKNENEE